MVAFVKSAFCLHPSVVFLHFSYISWLPLSSVCILALPFSSVLHFSYITLSKVHFGSALLQCITFFIHHFVKSAFWLFPSPVYYIFHTSLCQECAFWLCPSPVYYIFHTSLCQECAFWLFPSPMFYILHMLVGCLCQECAFCLRPSANQRQPICLLFGIIRVDSLNHPLFLKHPVLNHPLFLNSWSTPSSLNHPLFLKHPLFFEAPLNLLKAPPLLWINPF